MLLGEPLASLITFFKMSLIKILSQQSTNVRFFLLHCKSTKLNRKKLSKIYSFSHVGHVGLPCRFAMF